MAYGKAGHGAPSASHEDRRRTLAAIGMLAGFRLPLSALPDGSVPDVVLVSQPDGALLIGDAKHTEGPSDPACLDRLAGYIAWLRRDRPAARADIFAVCHPIAHGEAWAAAVEALAARAGVASGLPRIGVVGPTSAVSWIPCFGAVRSSYSAASGRAP